MGFVLLCFSIGATLGPAVGGALYAKSGYNGPSVLPFFCSPQVS